MKFMMHTVYDIFDKLQLSVNASYVFGIYKAQVQKVKISSIKPAHNLLSGKFSYRGLTQLGGHQGRFL